MRQRAAEAWGYTPCFGAPLSCSFSIRRRPTPVTLTNKLRLKYSTSYRKKTCRARASTATIRPDAHRHRGTWTILQIACKETNAYAEGLPPAVAAAGYPIPKPRQKPIEVLMLSARMHIEPDPAPPPRPNLQSVRTAAVEALPGLPAEPWSSPQPNPLTRPTSLPNALQLQRPPAMPPAIFLLLVARAG